MGPSCRALTLSGARSRLTLRTGDATRSSSSAWPRLTVKESVSRIQAALRNSGYRWPGPKVTINLAPADVKKDSAAFDLPIALATMVAGSMFAS